MIKSRRRNGRVCGIYGTEEKYVDFWWGNLKEGHLKYVGVDGKIILKCLLMKEGGVARTRFIWLIIRAVLNRVMNLQVSLNAGIF